MVTWMQLWWELIAPVVLITVFGVAIPTIHFGGHVSGSGPIRQWLINECLLPLFSNDAAQQIVTWLMQGGAGREIAVVAFIAININVALLPLLWAQGEATIRIKSWLARKSLSDRRRLIRG
jgi:fumarate reductase subunit D